MLLSARDPGDGRSRHGQVASSTQKLAIRSTKGLFRAFACHCLPARQRLETTRCPHKASRACGHRGVLTRAVVPLVPFDMREIPEISAPHACEGCWPLSPRPTHCSRDDSRDGPIDGASEQPERGIGSWEPRCGLPNGRPAFPKAPAPDQSPGFRAGRPTRTPPMQWGRGNPPFRPKIKRDALVQPRRARQVRGSVRCKQGSQDRKFERRAMGEVRSRPDRSAA